MKTNLETLIKAMAEQLSNSDIISAKQLAKISAIITKKRLDLKMNQTQFAKHIGVSQSMVSKWESEEYNFTIGALAKICDKLDLELDVTIKDNKKHVTEKLIRYSNSWSCIAKKPLSVDEEVA